MQKIINWLTQQRLINFGVGISAVVAYEIARAYYRPFIYANHINDFFIADTLGNSLGTVATAFGFVALLGRGGRHDYFLIRAAALGVVAYELAQPLLGKPIDGRDVVATMLAGLVCEGLYRWLHGQPPTAARPDSTPT